MPNALLLALLTLFVMAPVHAHKVVASAWADGDAIEGEVGLSNGEMAAEGTRVEIFGPAGEKLGETVTDADGLFRFTPTQAIAHRFRADLGAGHVAEVSLTVDELPIGLQRSAKTNESATASVAADVEAPAQLALPDFEALIAAAVRREIKPLRKELAAYKEKNDLQNILGGLGYICGIFGLAFFIYARRHNNT